MVATFAAALGLGHQGSAHAQVVASTDFWKQTAERRATVNRFVYSQSPQSIPSTYDPVREAEEILRQRQAALPASNPATPSLWQRVRAVPQRVGLSPAIRTLSPIALGPAVFEFGWKLGEGVEAKYVKFNVPEPVTHATITSQQLSWVRGGYVLRQPGSGTNPWNGISYSYPALVMPYDGWVWKHQRSGHPAWWDWYDDTDLSWCDTFASPPPPPVGLERIEAALECTTHPYAPPKAVGKTIGYTTPEHALRAAGPIEPYSGQPYTRSSPAPTPPPRTTVEQSIDNELAQPENSLLRQWLNYHLGSPGETDPLRIGLPNADIEFPNFEKKHGEHGPEFAIPYTDPREYWRDAADIVKRGRNSDPTIIKCPRSSDGAILYWDGEKQALVIEKDGKIDNYFPPTRGFDYFVEECSR